MERIPRGMFMATVIVNNVLRHTSEGSSKKETVNATIHGIQKLVQQLRGIWANMQNFFHTKLNATGDVLTTFNDLRLANIAQVRDLNILYYMAI